ncbi:MAG: hypothetical protein JXB26_01065 [Candidatus Aminicenantes bacterium]|nr:hypothetical protein [Candidatus Aminicenantes bacterium]
MKKWVFFLTLVVFVFGLTACGGGKYADAKKLMEKQVQVFENFVNGLDKAENAEAVAAALNNFSDEMKSMVPQMKAIQEKYPELDNAADEDIPAELKPLIEKLEKEIMPKFMSAMMKIGQYADDPVVKEANEKFQQTMSELR